MSVTILIQNAPADAIKMLADPLAELGAMLHAITNGDHHPRSRYLRERIHQTPNSELIAQANRFAPFYGAIRARFMLPLTVPARYTIELACELDDIARLTVEQFVSMSAPTLTLVESADYSTLLTCRNSRREFLQRVERISMSRTELAQDLLAEPGRVQQQLLEFLSTVGRDWFEADWRQHVGDLTRDVQRRLAEVRTKGVSAIAGIVPTASLRQNPDRVVFDKINSQAITMGPQPLVLIPSFHCSPHLIVKNYARFPQVVLYEVLAEHHDTMAALERRISALNDHTRIQICRLVLRHPRTTVDISIRLGQTQPQVSRHLRVLREAGLVTAEREGRVVYYSLDAAAFRMLGNEFLAALRR